MSSSIPSLTTALSRPAIAGGSLSESAQDHRVRSLAAAIFTRQPLPEAPSSLLHVPLPKRLPKLTLQQMADLHLDSLLEKSSVSREEGEEDPFSALSPPEMHVEKVRNYIGLIESFAPLLGFDATVVGALQKMSTSLVPPDAPTIAHRLKTLKPHESLLMVGGWIPYFGVGHSMLYEFIGKEGGLYDLYIYNTGEGVDYHPSKKEEGKTLYQFFLKFADLSPRELSLEAGQQNAFLSKLLALQKRMYEERHSAHHLYWSPYLPQSALRPLLPKIAPPSSDPDDYITAQQGGTCTASVILAYLRRKLGSKTLYKEGLILTLKYTTLLAFYQQRVAGLASDSDVNREALYILQEGVANFMRSKYFASSPIPLNPQIYQTMKELQSEVNQLHKAHLHNYQEEPLGFTLLSEKNYLLKAPPYLHPRVGFQVEPSTLPLFFEEKIEAKSFVEAAIRLSTRCRDLDPGSKVASIEDWLKKIAWAEESYWAAIPEGDRLQAAHQIYTLFQIYERSYQVLGTNLIPAYEISAYTFLACMQQLIHALNPELRACSAYPWTLKNLDSNKFFLLFSKQEVETVEKLQTLFKRDHLYFQHETEVEITEATPSQDALLLWKYAQRSEPARSKIKEAIKDLRSDASWEPISQQILIQVVLLSQDLLLDTPFAYLDYWKYMSYQVLALSQKGKIEDKMGLSVMDNSARLDWFNIKRSDRNNNYLKVDIDDVLLGEDDIAHETKMYYNSVLYRPKEVSKEASVNAELLKELTADDLEIPLEVLAKILPCQKSLQCYKYLYHYRKQKLKTVDAQVLFLHTFFQRFKHPSLGWPIAQAVENPNFIHLLKDFLEEGFEQFHKELDRGNYFLLSEHLFFLHLWRRIDSVHGSPCLPGNSRIALLNDLLGREGLAEENRAEIHLHRLLEYPLREELTDAEWLEVAKSWLMASCAPLQPTWHNLMQLEEAKRWIPRIFPQLWDKVTVRQDGIWSLLRAVGNLSQDKPLDGTFELSCPFIRWEGWQINLLTGKVQPPAGMTLPGGLLTFFDNKSFTEIFASKMFPARRCGETYTFNDSEGRAFRCDKTTFLHHHFKGNWIQFLLNMEKVNTIPSILISDHTAWRVAGEERVLFLDKKSWEHRYTLEGGVLRIEGGGVVQPIKPGRLALFEEPEYILAKKLELSSEVSTLTLEFSRYHNGKGEVLSFTDGVWDSDPRFGLSQNQRTNLLGACQNYLLLDDGSGHEKIVVPFRGVQTSYSLIPRAGLRLSSQLMDLNEGAFCRQSLLRTYFVFDVHGNEVRPTTTEQRLFLAYLYLAQKEYERARYFLDQVKHVTSFSERARKILTWITTVGFHDESTNPHAAPLIYQASKFLNIKEFSFSTLLLDSSRTNTPYRLQKLLPPLPEAAPSPIRWNVQKAKNKEAPPQYTSPSSRFDLSTFVSRNFLEPSESRRFPLTLNPEPPLPSLRSLLSAHFESVAHPFFTPDPPPFTLAEAPDPIAQHEQEALQKTYRRGVELNREQRRYFPKGPEWRQELSRIKGEVEEQRNSIKAEIEKLLSTLHPDPLLAEKELFLIAGGLIDAPLLDEYKTGELLKAFREGGSMGYAAINPHLSLQEIQRLDSLVHALLVHEVYLHQIKRVEEASSPQAAALLLTEERSYTQASPFYRLFLFYEYRKGISIWKEQVDLLRALIQIKDGKIQNATAQLLMGKGKSTTITPLILEQALILGYLPFSIVPETQLSTFSATLTEVMGIIFGRKVYTLSLLRSDLKLDKLREVLATLQLAKEEKSVISTTPNTLHNLSLELLSSLEKNDQERVKPLRAISSLIKEFGFASIDEIDQVLDPLTEVNVPVGDKVLVQPIYAHLLFEIFSLALPHLKPKSGREGDTRFQEIDEATYCRELLPSIIERLSDYPDFDLTEAERPLCKEYLLGREVPEFEANLAQRDKSPFVKRHTSAGLISLTRDFLHRILPVTFHKSLNRHYGRPKPEHRLAAIFYSAVDTPSPTEIGNIWEAAAYHFQAALFGEISRQEIKMLGNVFLEAGANHFARDGVSKISQTLEGKSFYHLTSIEVEDLDSESALDKAYRYLNADPSRKLEFEMENVVASVGAYPLIFRGNPESLVEMFASVCGFSGTLTKNNQTYHASLSDSPYLDEGAEGRVFDVLLRKPLILHTTASAAIEEVVLAMKRSPRCHDIGGFIDICGLLKENTGYEIADSILNHLDFEAVLYFDRRSSEEHVPGTLMALKWGQREPEILNSTDEAEIERHGLKGKRLFVFLRNGLTQGTNILQPERVINWISLDSRLDPSSLSQGVMRLRQLLQQTGQEVEFIALEGMFPAGVTLSQIFQKAVLNATHQKAKETLRAYSGPKLDNALERFAWHQLRTVEESALFTCYEKYKGLLLKLLTQDPYLLFGSPRALVATLTDLENRKEAKVRRVQRLAPEFAGEAQKSLEDTLEGARRSVHLPPTTIQLLKDPDLAQHEELGLQIALSLSTEVETALETSLTLALYRSMESKTPKEESPWEASELSRGSLFERYRPVVDPLQKEGMCIYSLAAVGAYFAKATEATPYPYPYHPLFSEEVDVTSNFLWTSTSLSPLLKFAADILIYPTREGSLKALLLSSREAANLKDYLTSHPIPEVRLILPDGTLYTPEAPAPYTPKQELQFLHLLSFINFLNGKVSYLIRKEERERTEWLMAEHPDLAPKYLKFVLEQRGDSDETALFYKHFELFTPQALGTTSFTCRARALQLQDIKIVLESLSSDEVEKLTLETPNIKEILNLIPPTLIPYLRDERLLKLLKPRQLCHLSEDQIASNPWLLQHSHILKWLDTGSR